MSLLGKILLFVNLLAAIGLAFLTTQDWAKRQEVNALGVRYYLTLTGVPVDATQGSAGSDEVAMAIDTAPGHSTTTIGKKTLESHFTGTGAVPTSQVEEVRAVKQKIDGLVANAPGEADKLRTMVGGLNAQNIFEPGYLIRYADTFEERQALRAMALSRDPKQVSANLADARQRLERKFEAVLSPPNPAAAQQDAQRLADIQGRLAANQGDATAAAELASVLSQGAPPYCRDDTDRRNRIAQLLMLSDPARDNQKRVALVVGLRTYARALNEQTGQMEEIVRRIERQIEQDQSKYQEEYELLKRLAVEQDQLLYQQQRVVIGLRDQAAEDDKHVSARQSQLQALETNLNEVTRTVAGLLQRQAEIEKSLFEVQRRVGDTLRGNSELEGQLLKTEDKK